MFNRGADVVSARAKQFVQKTSQTLSGVKQFVSGGGAAEEEDPRRSSKGLTRIAEKLLNELKTETVTTGKGKIIKRCARGRLIVNWIVTDRPEFSRKEATEVGNLLKLGGVLSPVQKGRPFTDDEELFSLAKSASKLEFRFVDEIKQYDEIIEGEAGSSASSESELLPVPNARGIPVVGNAHQAFFMGAQRNTVFLGQKYGGIFRLQLFERSFISVTDRQLAGEALTRPEFGKIVEGDAVFDEIKDFRGAASLTAISDGEEHDLCQRVVLPGFSSKSLVNLFDVVLKGVQMTIEQLKAGEKYDIRKLMVDTTIRTAGMVAMSYKFDNSEEANTLKEAVVYAGLTTFDRAYNPKLMKKGIEKKYRKLADFAHRLIETKIEQRKKEHEQEEAAAAQAAGIDVNLERARRKAEQAKAGSACPMSPSAGAQKLGLRPENKWDMLDRMLYSGKLTNHQISSQILTILAAGHATTTATLSWTFYLLSQNPDAAYRLFMEIDNISGGSTSYWPTHSDLQKMVYLKQVIYEALRLYPPVGSVMRRALKDTNLGQYSIRKDEDVLISVLGVHRDEKTWPDPLTFNPDNFAPDRERLPFSFIPWVAGARQCIGQDFAMVATRTILFCISNHYKFDMAKGCKMKIEDGLFINPKNVKLVPRVRTVRYNGVAVNDREKEIHQKEKGKEKEEPHRHKYHSGEQALKPLACTSAAKLVIAYGSNLGTAKEYAEQLFDQAQELAFVPTILGLDEYLESGKIKEGGNLVIVTATYNGLPTDNATKFVAWLKSNKDAGACKGLKYAVFGCGNKQWFSTYQAVPKLVHESLAKYGGVPFMNLTAGDASGNMAAEFEEWTQELWPTIIEHLGFEKEPDISNRLRESMHVPSAQGMELLLAEAGTGEAQFYATVASSEQTYACKLLQNRELQSATSDRSTRHIEIELQKGMTYEAGDHLAVCPANSVEMVETMASLLGYPLSNIILLEKNSKKRGFLPVNTPLRVDNILTNLVDLSVVPSKKVLTALAPYANSEKDKSSLKLLTSSSIAIDDAYSAWAKKRYNIVETLKQFPSVKGMPLTALLEVMQPLKPRYYSISSSPLELPNAVSITVGVVNEPLPEDRTYHGVSSSYLGSLQPDDIVHVYTKSSGACHFQPPVDNSTPIIMVGAGTGMSPFRGFMQERRARQKASGKPAGPARFFFGCQHPSRDYIYEDEFKQWCTDGVLSHLHTAFSRVEGTPKRYVQDEILDNKDAVWTEIADKGAVFYVCGSGRTMAAGVHEALLQIGTEKLGSKEKAEAFLTTLAEEQRYLRDVWG